jgi:hypothetical protein
LIEGEHFVGKSHTFPDGDRIEVFQVKERGPEQQLVSYYVYQGPGIPRKLVMTLKEFTETYGHLFGEE